MSQQGFWYVRVSCSCKEEGKEEEEERKKRLINIMYCCCWLVAVVCCAVCVVIQFILRHCRRYHHQHPHQCEARRYDMIRYDAKKFDGDVPQAKCDMICYDAFALSTM